MTDKPLSDLFAEGTAPETDAAFTRGVEAEIGRARLRGRLLAIARPATAVLALSGLTFVTAGAVRPLLGQLIEGTPRFMGVPAPVVLCAALAALALGARRYVLSR